MLRRSYVFSSRRNHRSRAAGNGQCEFLSSRRGRDIGRCRDRRCDGSCHITAKGGLLIPAAATLGSMVRSPAASRLENRPVLLILTVLHRVRLARGSAACLPSSGAQTTRRGALSLASLPSRLAFISVQIMAASEAHCRRCRLELRPRCTAHHMARWSYPGRASIDFTVPWQPQLPHRQAASVNLCPLAPNPAPVRRGRRGHLDSGGGLLDLAAASCGSAGRAYVRRGERTAYAPIPV
jgi:hypothetical protein